MATTSASNEYLKAAYVKRAVEIPTTGNADTAWAPMPTEGKCKDTLP